MASCVIDRVCDEAPATQFDHTSKVNAKYYNMVSKQTTKCMRSFKTFLNCLDCIAFETIMFSLQYFKYDVKKVCVYHIIIFYMIFMFSILQILSHENENFQEKFILTFLHRQVTPQIFWYI